MAETNLGEKKLRIFFNYHEVFFLYMQNIANTNEDKMPESHEVKN